MRWVGRIISALVSALLLFSAFGKLEGNPQALEGMLKLGIPNNLLVPLAILEATCVALYLIPMTSVTGAILLTGYMGGAILAHLRVADDIIIQIVIPIVVWLGLYLREPRLRDLIPMRRRFP